MNRGLKMFEYKGFIVRKYEDYFEIQKDITAVEQTYDDKTPWQDQAKNIIDRLVGQDELWLNKWIKKLETHHGSFDQMCDNIKISIPLMNKLLAGTSLPSIDSMKKLGIERHSVYTQVHNFKLENSGIKIFYSSNKVRPEEAKLISSIGMQPFRVRDAKWYIATSRGDDGLVIYKDRIYSSKKGALQWVPVGSAVEVVVLHLHFDFPGSLDQLKTQIENIQKAYQVLKGELNE